MWQDRRLTFMQKWFARALEESDPFDRFFSLWICLVVGAQRDRTLTGQWVEDDRDGLRVVDYLQAHASQVAQALAEHTAETRWLAYRTGTRLRIPLVDTRSDDLREKFRRLSLHWAGRAVLPAEQVAGDTAEFLNKVRNNVFHGVKVYDDRDDLALLTRVNPLLVSILRTIEPDLQWTR